MLTALNKKKGISNLTLIVSLLCLAGISAPVNAQYLSGGVNQNQVSATSRFFARHPKLRKAAIGSGLGTATGALTGLISGKGVVRGAAIGAGTGGGVALVSSSELMKRHPIVRDTTVGTISGAGIALSSTKRGKLKNMSKGAGVGAAVGMAVGLLRTGLR